MRVLYLSGFLGSSRDLSPLSRSEDENVFVDLRSLIGKSKNLLDLKSEFMNKYEKKAYDKAIGYSFGGRLLSQLDINVEQRVFISANISHMSKEEVNQRDEMASYWIKEFKESFLEAKRKWSDLPLFQGHSMQTYRRDFSIAEEEWTKLQTLSYFTNFFTFKESPFLRNNDLYLYGSLDQKYANIGVRIKDILKVKEVENTGHRCCYENPQALKNLIWSV